MIIALAVVALAAGVWFGLQGFSTKVLCYLTVLPFVTYMQIHAPSRWWSLVPTALLAATALTAFLVRPAEPRAPAAYGMTAMVLAYAGLSAVEAFNPGLPSVTLGLRGLRLVVEPVLLYFVGAEVARRPALLRRILVVILATGTVVILYALKQSAAGFDRRELSYFRRTFAVAARESRVFGTMAGASVLGHYVLLVVLLGVAAALRGGRWAWTAVPLAAAGSYVILLTGQRGVMVAAGVCFLLLVVLALARPDTRRGGIICAAGLAVVFGLFAVLVATTPVQDRRLASTSGRANGAFQAARIKVALLKSGGQESSLKLRVDRLIQLRDALDRAPFGVGTGLNLLIEPSRSGRATVLGTAGFGGPDYHPKVDPIPGELYYYTLGSETGLLGLALFVGIALAGIVAAWRVTAHATEPIVVVFAIAAVGFFVAVLVDSFDVDAMTSTEVASYFWLLLGAVAVWARRPPVAAPAT